MMSFFFFFSNALYCSTNNPKSKDIQLSKISDKENKAEPRHFIFSPFLLERGYFPAHQLIK